MRVLVIFSELIYFRDRIEGATRARLEEGLEVWKRREHDLIVVTGGIFLPEDIQTLPAAVLMKEWLVKKGVDERRIIAEDGSVDSFENVSFTRSELERRRVEIRRPGEAVWTLVSHKTHIRRLLVTCRAHGIRAVGHPVNYRLPLMARFGERLAWLVHVFDPRGLGWIARRNQKRRRERTWRPAALLEPQ